MCVREKESVRTNVFILKRGNSKQIPLFLKTPQADFPAYLACVCLYSAVWGIFGLPRW